VLAVLAWPAMTDARAGSVRASRNTLGLRLTLAFLAVALAAIALPVGLAAAFVSAPPTTCYGPRCCGPERLAGGHRYRHRHPRR
jgi:hypothetical protein